MLVNPSNTRRYRRGSVARYALPLLLLMAIIGGITWVVQYLPSTRSRNETPRPEGDRKHLLDFSPPGFARWAPLDPGSDGDAASPGKDKYPFKDFEAGEKGHYDFLFKNVADTDVEIIAYSSACDCASVQAGALAEAEHERLLKFQSEKPGDPLPYATAPPWIELGKDEPGKKRLKVQANATGVIRVNWVASKSAGQMLRVNPHVWFQPAGDPAGRLKQALAVPVMVRQVIQFHPQRVNFGVLAPGAIARETFVAWTSTRDVLPMALALPDPFFRIETTPLSKKECAALEASLDRAKISTRVRAAVSITVTVYETMSKRQLDQGSFYRQPKILIDGFPAVDVPAPEFVGRVSSDIQIGGADDQGKIRMKSFERTRGTTTRIELSTKTDVELQTHTHAPDWLEVKLSKKEVAAQRQLWQLQVSVLPDTPTLRSLDEPDAVVLRIVGKEDRFLRIPVEGHSQATR